MAEEIKKFLDFCLKFYRHCKRKMLKILPGQLQMLQSLILWLLLYHYTIVGFFYFIFCETP